MKVQWRGILLLWLILVRISPRVNQILLSEITYGGANWCELSFTPCVFKIPEESLDNKVTLHKLGISVSHQ